MLKRIIIKNFRSIKFLDYKVEKSSNLHLFMGINESGKSNILKAINCLLDGFKSSDINIQAKENNEKAYIIFGCELSKSDFFSLKIVSTNSIPATHNYVYYIAFPDEKVKLLNEDILYDNSPLEDKDLIKFKREYSDSINGIFLDGEYKNNVNSFYEFFQNILDCTNEFIHNTNICIFPKTKNNASVSNSISNEIKIFNINVKNNISYIINNNFNLKNQRLKFDKFTIFFQKLKNINENNFFDFLDEKYKKNIVNDKFKISRLYKVFEKIKNDWMFIFPNLHTFFKKIDDSNKVLKNRYNILYISSYINDLKENYSWEEILKNNNLIIKMLLRKANISIDNLVEIYNKKNIHMFNKIENDINLIFSNDLDFFYSLERISLKIRFDINTGMKLYVQNETKNENLLINKIKDRSDGFKQFLSLIIIFGKVLSKKEENNNFYNILLLDEPGYSLHPKAQQCLVNKMLEWSKEMQIFYTSHFPYMIQENGLDKILVVSKNLDEGTKINIFPFSDFKLGSSNSKNEDPILPIMIYLGLDIETELWSKKRKICILEGISDVYYFKTFLNIVKDEEINNDSIMLIPKFGSNFPGIISYIAGLEKEYIYIVDSDSNNKIKNEISEYDLESKILDYEIILGRKACIEEIVFKTKPKNFNKKQLAFDFYNDLKINDFILEKLKSQEKWENVDFDNLKTNIEKIVKTMKETFKKKINF